MRMTVTSPIESLPRFLKERRADNMQKAGFISFLLAVISAVYVVRYLTVTEIEGRQNYLYVFLLITILSLLFRILYEFIRSGRGSVLSDGLLFAYYLLVFFILIALGVLDSLKVNDLTAVVFAYLGLAFVYRCSALRFLILEALGALAYCAGYVFYAGHAVTMAVILPLAITVVFSLFIARSRENLLIRLFDVTLTPSRE